jgi:hypothetical protein
MGRNRIPFVVAGVLIVLLGGGVILMKSSKKSSKPKVPQENARALSVPTNLARTVVVAPCNTPLQQTTSAAAKGQGTPGATTFELPQGGGTRYVLVPHCQPKAGVTETPGPIPSAAYVLPSGARPSEGQGGSLLAGQMVARTQLLLPNGAKTSTIVVAPCTKKSAGKRDVALSGDARTVAAPKC